ncbi:DnaJ domain-containing protein [Syntrophus gentianae]|uniref:DnaJ domain-containing protein n=1 Tax=Syntrophus gentianae TaxID=43775 RepID=A0A1H7YZX3_9BACT|nr:J domain-containing protein [Syntrophus gentianae]SEM51720.1 DnaJ domain-containing protein [Syntrophus gentianae]
MNDLVAIKEKRKNRCLACGETIQRGRRKYCSTDCRQRLRNKLDLRTGLVQALNAQYATFYFSELLIIMDMIPFSSREIYSFSFPRSRGKKPADDFSRMADHLGEIWWAEQRRTNKKYLASKFLLERAVRNTSSVSCVKPYEVRTPSIQKKSLQHLNLDSGQLNRGDPQQVIRNAYRRQVKIHHPDLGGDADMFRKIQTAYESLTLWAKNPTFVKRRGFPDKWFYDGNTNKWLQPISL